MGPYDGTRPMKIKYIYVCLELCAMLCFRIQFMTMMSPKQVYLYTSVANN